MQKSRRWLAALLAGMLMLGAMGCTKPATETTAAVQPETTQPAPSSEQETTAEVLQGRDIQTQVAVVGAGGAGMAAAIEAKDLGLEVILIEKLAFVGGTTSMASTAYNAGGMKLQLEADPPFTADDAYQAWIGSGEDDPYLRLLADRSGATGDWLVDMGADLGKFNGKQVMPSDGSALGSMLVGVLDNAVKERGIDLRTETTGTSLVTDETGKVTGIQVTDVEGYY